MFSVRIRRNTLLKKLQRNVYKKKKKKMIIIDMYRYVCFSPTTDAQVSVRVLQLYGIRNERIPLYLTSKLGGQIIVRSKQLKVS